jgi:hypothetical protein
VKEDKEEEKWVRTILKNERGLERDERVKGKKGQTERIK